MSRIARFVAASSPVAWLAVITAIALATGATVWTVQEVRENGRAALLKTEAQRRGIEITGQTLNSNLMGAVALLGLLEDDIKREAQGGGEVQPNGPRLLDLLENVTRAYDAKGAFLVSRDGFIRSYWEITGKKGSGTDVNFRPYFKMAMRGKENVYAAIGLVRNERVVYYTAPVYAAKTRDGAPVGSVVAQTDVAKIDAALKDLADIALLLTPQGVVFASNRPEWLGFLDGEATPERVRAIRDLRQFGKLFEKKEPQALPFALNSERARVNGHSFALARAAVHWNDPSGDWQLVLLEDLARSVPLAASLWAGAGAALALLLLTLMLRQVLTSHHAKQMAAAQVASYARAQELDVQRKSQLNAAALAFQQAENVAGLARTFLQEAHAALGALQGVVYVATPGAADGALHLAASYACAEPVADTLLPGEGLLGQCVHTGAMRVVETPAEGAWSLRSGLGGTRPAALLMAPALLKDSLQGVVEIAVLNVPGAEQTAQFEEMVKLLALNLEIVRRSERTEEQLSASVAAERAKSEQLAFQQVLLDSIPYPVFHMDFEARLSGANTACARIFGVERGALPGQRLTDLTFLPPAERAALQAEAQAVIADAAKVEREIRIPRNDGTLRDALYFLSGFRQADGSPGGLVGAFVDISAMKDAQRKLAQLADADRFNRIARGRELRIIEMKREVNELAQALGRAAPYDTSRLDAADRDELAPQDASAPVPAVTELPKRLEELVDLAELQILFTHFCESVGVAAAIIDLEGKVLAAARWQKACTDFHRVNPDSCARCIESDTELALRLGEGESFTMYRCKNGMTDCAAPIKVEGEHLANVFIGQFHSSPPDIVFFKKQARQFGYPEEEYLRAIEAAPTLDAARLPMILGFLTGFARMIATMSLATRRAEAAQQALQLQAEVLRQERLTAMSLAEDAARLHSAANASTS